MNVCRVRVETSAGQLASLAVPGSRLSELDLYQLPGAGITALDIGLSSHNPEVEAWYGEDTPVIERLTKFTALQRLQLDVTHCKR